MKRLQTFTSKTDGDKGGLDPDYIALNLDEYLEKEGPNLKNVQVSPR